MKRLTTLTAATTVALSLVVTPNASANDINYFTASNGVTIPVIKASEGNQGTLVFLNGDGTRRYTTPDSHFIQGIVDEVKSENVDSLFLLPPNNQDSWWRTRDVDSWCDAVREYLNTLQTPAIEVAGYSGGAEFIGRYLMLDETTWVPNNTSFTMIGGGSIGGYSVNPPAPGKEGTKLDWVVGHNDTWLRDQPTFSARHAAERSETEYKRTGFDNTTLELVSGDHYNYDFAQILGSSVREMKSSAAPAPQPVAPPAPPAPPAPVPEAPAPGAPVPPPAENPAPAPEQQPAPAPEQQPAPAPVPEAPAPGAPVPPPADKPAPAPEQKPAPAPAPEKPAPAPEKPNKGSDNGDASKDQAALAWGRVWAFFSSLLVMYAGSNR